MIYVPLPPPPSPSPPPPHMEMIENLHILNLLAPNMMVVVLFLNLFFIGTLNKTLEGGACFHTATFKNTCDYNVFIVLQCHLNDHLCRKVIQSNNLLLLKNTCTLPSIYSI